MEIHGHCDDRFSGVLKAFENNFENNGDIGACFAATLEGEYVVDIWAGHQDKAKTRPWQEDTIINVYSTTKTMTFIVALMLASICEHQSDNEGHRFGRRIHIDDGVFLPGPCFRLVLMTRPYIHDVLAL